MVALVVVEVAASWKPQFEQNLAVVETACPQFGQVRGIAWPQFSQNLAVGELS